MRRLSLGSPLGNGPDSFQTWAKDAFQQIEQASAEDIEAVIGEFQITGTYTASRTLAADTATLADLRAFVATLVSDIQKRGQKRAYAT